jgi:hypothetical protein
VRQSDPEPETNNANKVTEACFEVGDGAALDAEIPSMMSPFRLKCRRHHIPAWPPRSLAIRIAAVMALSHKKFGTQLRHEWREAPRSR